MHTLYYLCSHQQKLGKYNYSNMRLSFRDDVLTVRACIQYNDIVCSDDDFSERTMVTRAE
jgi:hypothetical protein